MVRLRHARYHPTGRAVLDGRLAPVPFKLTSRVLAKRNRRSPIRPAAIFVGSGAVTQRDDGKIDIRLNRLVEEVRPDIQRHMLDDLDNLSIVVSGCFHSCKICVADMSALLHHFCGEADSCLCLRIV